MAMTIDERTSSFIERAKALFTRPKEVWPEIDRDMTPSGELFTRYAAPLAALAPIVGFITGRVFNWSPFGFSFFGQLFTAVGGYAFSMVNLLVLSFIASKLAPRFGGEGSPRDAFKLIVYSSTAAWIANALAMIPGLGFIGIGSLFSLYLFFLGIGPIMKVPEMEKRRFGAITIVCAVALNLVTMGIANTPAMILGGPRPHVTFLHDWGNSGIDRQAIRNVERQMRDAFRHGDMKTIPPAQLQALLPTRIGGFARTGTENVSTGFGSGFAQGTYAEGDKTFTVKIVDLGRFGATFGNMMPIDQNKQDEDGFKNVTNKGGTFVSQTWDNDDKSGDYMTVADKRFLIEAKGEADSFDGLKQAVGSIDPAKLAALEK